MRTIRYKAIVITASLILLCGFVLFRWLQGPVIAAYSVASMPLVQTVVATGRLVTVSRTQIGSEITGVVLERHVQEGDRVVKGDILLVLKADDIAAQVRQAKSALIELETSTRPQTKVALANAKIQLEQASREVVRRRDLANRSLISAELLEQALQAENLARNTVESARLKVTAAAPGNVEETVLQERLVALQAQLAKTVLRAEVAGTVLTRNAEPGDLIQPGRVLFTIALDGQTEIHVPLDERNLSLLALDQSATAIADAYPDNPFAARINFIAPSINPQSGTVEVKLTVDPVPDFLRQDMTVSVNIETGQRDNTLVLPNDALSNVNRGKAQVLLVKDGKLKRQSVTLGLRGLAMSEILKGVSVSDTVLVDASSTLADGTKVRVELQKTRFTHNNKDVNTKNELPVKLN